MESVRIRLQQALAGANSSRSFLTQTLLVQNHSQVDDHDPDMDEKEQKKEAKQQPPALGLAPISFRAAAAAAATTTTSVGTGTAPRTGGMIGTARESDHSHTTDTHLFPVSS